MINPAHKVKGYLIPPYDSKYAFFNNAKAHTAQYIRPHNILHTLIKESPQELVVIAGNKLVKEVAKRTTPISSDSDGQPLNLFHACEQKLEQSLSPA
jgi:hypothetical protein